MRPWQQAEGRIFLYRDSCKNNGKYLSESNVFKSIVCKN